MEQILSSAAATFWAAAAFLVVLVGFAVMLGANAARDRLLTAVVGAILAGLLLNTLSGALHRSDIDSDRARVEQSDRDDRPTPEEPLGGVLCAAVALGHLVLGLVLLLRWLRPRAGVERAEERRRARLRERQRVPPRDVEIDP